MFYNLGEVKFAKGQTDEAAKWYQKAVDLDPSWGKPLFKLALVALNKGDKDGDDQDDGESHRRRSDVAGSRAGQSGHRAAEEVEQAEVWAAALALA